MINGKYDKFLNMLNGKHGKHGNSMNNLLLSKHFISISQTMHNLIIYNNW